MPDRLLLIEVMCGIGGVWCDGPLGSVIVGVIGILGWLRKVVGRRSVMLGFAANDVAGSRDGHGTLATCEAARSYSHINCTAAGLWLIGMEYQSYGQASLQGMRRRKKGWELGRTRAPLETRQARRLTPACGDRMLLEVR